jgi:chemotaxis protein methyltransferase CheR
MNSATFDGFKTLIYERCGISLNESKKALLMARVARHMRRLNIDSHDEYLYYVTRDRSGEEIQNLVDAISTNVTSFYREGEHFDILRAFIRERIGKGAKRLRLWSAACSSGEEPYTMAIEALDTLGDSKFDVRILATDINFEILRECQAGVYSAEKVKPVPGHLRTRYLQKQNGSGEPTFAVTDALRKLVVVRQMNLNKVPYPVSGPLDVIFCRNVMIYFEKQTRAKVIGEFRRVLAPGGYLFLGHAESLSNLSEGFVTIAPSVYLRC